MKFSSVFKTLLTIMIVFTIVVSYNETSKGYQEKPTLAYDNVDFDMTNNLDKEYVKFTNTYNYPVELTENDIYLVATGETREDEQLVEKNMKINVKFKKEGSSVLEDTITVAKKETIYIVISSNYEGELPSNEVNVQYGINISLS